jgi:hypothetical protein
MLKSAARPQGCEVRRCDRYDSALVPVALVNHLISLSQHPSARILQRFARERVKR